MRRQQYEVVLVGLNLCLLNACLTGDQVEELVGLLARTLLLLVIFLDKLGKFGRSLRHGPLILLLSVVGLCLTLELRNDLVFLSQFEMELTKLVL